MKRINIAALSCLLAFGLVPQLGDVCAAARDSLAPSFTVPTGTRTWTVVVADSCLTVLYIHVVRGPQAPYRVTMQLLVREWPTSGPASLRPLWPPAAVSEPTETLFLSPRGIAARHDPTKKVTDLVLELGQNLNYFFFMQLRGAWMLPAQGEGKFGFSPLTAQYWRQRPCVEWVYWGDDQKQTGSGLQRPALAEFRQAVYVAGDVWGPSGLSSSVWVSTLRAPTESRLKVTLVETGAGAPALLSTANKLFCFAIRTAKPIRGWSEGWAGPVVCWMSSDGEKWEAWNPGMLAEDVACLDACSDGGRNFLAAISGFPAPVIRLYELDKETEKLRELYSFSVPEPGNMAPRVLVRVLDGAPYLFWCQPENSDFYTTRIFLHRAELAPAGQSEATLGLPRADQ